MFRVLVGLTALAGLSASTEAHAMRCSITNAVGPAFGGYDTLSAAPLDSTGYISFRCDQVAPFDSIVIELGRGRGNSFSPRRMRWRGQRLDYNLYLDAARTLIWGDGSRGTARYHARPIEGRTESIPIHARIPPRQPVRPGPYSDHVVLTIQY